MRVVSGLNPPRPIARGTSFQAFQKRHARLKPRVDRLLKRFLADQPSNVRPLLHTALFPGRRIRPSLFLRLVGVTRSATTICKKMALALELSHRASIIIDDLVDADNYRRSTPTFHIATSSENAVLVSHYLVGGALDSLALLPVALRSKATQAFLKAYKGMTIGEMADLGFLAIHAPYAKFYRENVTRKSSASFELVFLLAALANDFSSKETLQMGRVGASVGRLFQMYNDVYDELHAEIDDRGFKASRRAALTLPKSVVMDLGTPFDRRHVTDAIGKMVPESSYRTIQAILRNPNYYAHIHRALNQERGRLATASRLIASRDIRTAINGITRWTAQPIFWDHGEYANAGY